MEQKVFSDVRVEPIRVTKRYEIIEPARSPDPQDAAPSASASVDPPYIERALRGEYDG